MKTIAVDTESKGGGAFGPLEKLYTIQIATPSGAKSYPIFCHRYADARGTAATEVLNIICQAERVLFANAAHDLNVLSKFYGDAWHGATLKWDDVLLMSWCLCPNRPYAAGEQHSLASWGERLGFPKQKLPMRWEEIHQALEQETAELTTDIGKMLVEYGQRDAELTLAIWEALQKELHALPAYVRDAALSTYNRIERPTVHLVIEMQSNGLKLDIPHLKQLRDEWAAILEQEEIEMRTWVHQNFGRIPANKPKVLKNPMQEKYVGRYEFEGQNEEGRYVYREQLEFNPKSNDHLTWVFQKLGWKPTEFSDKTHRPSLTKDQIDDLVNEYELAKQLKTFREFEKLYTTYAVAMHTMASAQDGWIYPSWHQSGTITGRYSCSNPRVLGL